eukprot:3678305-Ditylum_brightwellii.AAC.1
MMHSDWKLEHVYGLSRGATILTNLSAYMDDVTWLDCLKHLVPGIRSMSMYSRSALLVSLFEYGWVQIACECNRRVGDHVRA